MGGGGGGSEVCHDFHVLAGEALHPLVGSIREERKVACRELGNHKKSEKKGGCQRERSGIRQIQYKHLENWDTVRLVVNGRETMTGGAHRGGKTQVRKGKRFIRFPVRQESGGKTLVVRLEQRKKETPGPSRPGEILFQRSLSLCRRKET